MRFHIGCSFRPKTLIKYIGLGLIGLLAFMGVHDFAKAETIDYTTIVVNQSNGTTTSLSCGYNSAGMCPTNISMFPQPPKTEYLMKYLYISFGNNQLVNGHNYNFQIQFHILRPTSDNNFEQESFHMYLSNNTMLSDNTIYWTQQNYYDSMYGEEATQFNYSGSFTSTNDLSFFTALTMENQEGIYGVFIDSVYLFDNDTGQEIIDSSTQNTIDIMNNQNQNTQNVINNNNSNTQEIKDTINDNLQSCRDSVNLFKVSDYGSTTSNGVTYSISNNIFNFSGSNSSSSAVGLWFANSNDLAYFNSIFQVGKTYTLSSSNNNNVNGFYIQINYMKNNSSSQSALTTYYFANSKNTFTIPLDYNRVVNVFIGANRGASINNTFSFQLELGSVKSVFENYGERICVNKIDNVANSINDTNQSIEELNDTISDDTIDTTTSNDFFDNFEDNHHGLAGIVSLPLTTIQSLNNASCSPLTLTIPYLQSNNTIQLPCLTPIYQQNFGTFFTLYQTIIFGFVSYYVCVSIFYMVKDFKDPNKDKIEVMDL